GHVLAAAVRQQRCHQQLLPASAIENELFRLDFQLRDPDHLFRTLFAVGRASLNPIQDLLVIQGFFGEAHPAAVAYGPRRFQQEQALLRALPVDARYAGLGLLGGEDLVNPAVDDPGVILARIECVEREFKALLSFDAAVAIDGVAAALRQNSANVTRETERGRLFRSLNAHVASCRLLSHLNLYVQFPIRQRHEPARRVNGGEAEIGNRETTLARNITFEAVRERAQDDKALRCPATPQRRLLGDDADRQR